MRTSQNFPSTHTDEYRRMLRCILSISLASNVSLFDEPTSLPPSPSLLPYA
jgi:hypothetical protein